MKPSHTFSLLRYEFYPLWGVLALSFFYGFLMLPGRSSDVMFSLSLGPEMMLLLVPSTSINALFLNGNYGYQTLKGPFVNSLEFFFSRALSRSSLFSIKASLYLGLTLIPLLIILAASLIKPIIRVELPYYTLAHRAATQQFYLTHFSDATLEKDEKDKEGNKYWVVLPYGRVDVACFTLIWVFTGALLYQVFVFALPVAQRWASFFFFFALLGLTALGRASGKVPSNYELGLAWVAQHTLLSLILLGLLTLIVQLYCCRRFVQTEITS